MVCGFVFKYDQEYRREKHVCEYCHKDGLLKEARKRGFRDPSKELIPGYLEPWRALIPRSDRARQSQEYVIII